MKETDRFAMLSDIDNVRREIGEVKELVKNHIDEDVSLKKTIESHSSLIGVQATKLQQIEAQVNKDNGLIYGVAVDGEMKGGIIPKLNDLQKIASAAFDELKILRKEGVLTRKQKYELYGLMISGGFTLLGTVLHVFFGLGG